MVLTKAQQTIWEKARAFGAGAQAVGLNDGTCGYLIARVVSDLGVIRAFPEFGPECRPFFETSDLSLLTFETDDPRKLFERLVEHRTDADMYFSCLATLHKARLKYEAILKMQPMPTLDQVGPRGLLQFGKISPAGLVGLLFWRKWFFDIDNRAGQETGYLFEPVIANAVGGTPVPARKSPVRRHIDESKGRQIDCLIGKDAYELKIRVTIAASGQGRWREELDYPVDCKASGYIPVLVVLDGTANPKLEELVKAFVEHGGKVYLGEAAWEHLENLAGETMSIFLDKYVRTPIRGLIDSAPDMIPDFAATYAEDQIVLSIGDEKLIITRSEIAAADGTGDVIPDDITDNIPG